MGFFSRDMNAAYMPIQLAGDLAKLANLSAQAKGKSSSKSFEDPQVKAWYELTLAVCRMAFEDAIKNNGYFNNEEAFHLLFRCICIIDDLDEYIDRNDAVTNRVKQELLLKYKEFSKPTLKNLSSETVRFLSRLDT